MATTTTTATRDSLRERAKALRLHGLLAHWDELTDTQLAWVEQWLQWETQERHHRGLQRRLRAAHLGRFKPLADGFEGGLVDFSIGTPFDPPPASVVDALATSDASKREVARQARGAPSR